MRKCLPIKLTIRFSPIPTFLAKPGLHGDIPSLSFYGDTERDVITLWSSRRKLSTSRANGTQDDTSICCGCWLDLPRCFIQQHIKVSKMSGTIAPLEQLSPENQGPVIVVVAYILVFTSITIAVTRLFATIRQRLEFCSDDATFLLATVHLNTLDSRL